MLFNSCKVDFNNRKLQFGTVDAVVTNLEQSFPPFYGYLRLVALSDFIINFLVPEDLSDLKLRRQQQ